MMNIIIKIKQFILTIREHLVIIRDMGYGPKD